MSAKNNCCFTANLGRDAEQRYTQGGMAILSFSIPTESGWGDKKKTSWLRCTIFGKKAESKLAEYLKKGQNVTVVGSVSINEYEKDGITQKSFEMAVDDVSLNGKASHDASQQSSQGQQHQQSSANHVSQNDPFADQPDFNSVPPEDDQIPF